MNILDTTSGVHIPDILPWMDLYYTYPLNTAQQLDHSTLEKILVELREKAIFEFSGEKGIWTNHTKGYSFVLFRSALRAQVIGQEGG